MVAYDKRAAHDAVAQNGLGVAFEQLGQSDKAEAAFRAALATDPKFATAAANLGKVLTITGEIDAATKWFERALELEPRNGSFYLCLVNNCIGAVDRHRILQMERLAREIDRLPSEQQIDLHFALAGACEHVGRYDDAFRHLQAGNALKRSTIEYDEAVRLSFFASIDALCTGPLVAALREYGNPSARPIFVFGMPRSGTTLVEQLLAAHPSVAAAGELNVFDHAIGQELMVPGMALSELPKRIRALGDRYIRATDEFAGRAPHMTDKLPLNFCFAPLIHAALPNARMIHVRRDRLDTCFSAYATHFAGQGLSYTYDLGELGRYYRAYERLSARWRVFLPAHRFIEVQYERLVDDFETEARRIAVLCDLTWSDEMLAFHQVRRSVRTASNVQVRRPLYRSAIGRSRPFTSHLAPLLDALTSG
jgi:tetratricopeptide (TPR) repeat protein